MANSSQGIVAWVESIASSLEQGNQWRLLAEFHKAPATFPLMILQFVDEVEECFSLCVQDDTDSFRLLYDRVPELQNLMVVADCLYRVWDLAKYNGLFTKFDGKLLPSLYFSVRECSGFLCTDDGCFRVRIASEATESDPGDEVWLCLGMLRDAAHAHSKFESPAPRPVYVSFKKKFLQWFVERSDKAYLSRLDEMGLKIHPDDRKTAGHSLRLELTSLAGTELHDEAERQKKLKEFQERKK